MDLDIKVLLYKKDRFKMLKELVSTLECSLIGIEGDKIDHISFLKLRAIFRSSGKKLIGKMGLVEKLRLIKDQDEIEKIRNACKITEKIFNDLLELSGDRINKLSEIELALEIEKLMIGEGGNGRSFDFVIASGSGTSMPHYIPSHRKIKNGILLMDFGTVYNNYCSDITRTIGIGNRCFSDKLRKLYHIVLSAQQKAIEACKEGISCEELDSKARKYISDMGYGEEFGHGLGHGVGLEVHEAPKISKRSGTILKENMVITIEPGIYIPGLCGIRIEDMFVVKKNGCKNLYNSKKEFTIIS